MFDPFLYHQNLKSNHRRCSTKKVFLEILQSSQESTCFGVPKFSKTLFFTEHQREIAFIFFSFIKNFCLWWNKCWGCILRNCIFPFFIARTSFRPWYVRDENAELNFWEDIKTFYQKLKPIRLPHGQVEAHLRIWRVKGMRSYVYLEIRNSLASLVNATDAKER